MSVTLIGLETVVTFLVILAILVFFHELGHFGAAKLFRMRVEEFAIGFGKRLFRVAFDGQTEYNIRALPLGGFVRIAGMEIEDGIERRLTGGGDAKTLETTNAGLLEQEAEEVKGADPDGFNSRPLFQRFVVILAGPVFSVALGWLAFCTAGLFFGLPGDKPTTKIAAVSSGGAADHAGIKAGDTIIAIDGVPVKDGEAMVNTIHASPNKPLLFTLRDSGAHSRAVSVTPKPSEVEGKKVGLIGISPLFPIQRVGIAESFDAGNRLLARYLVMLKDVFAQGRVKENLGGPIAMIKMTRESISEGGPYSYLLLAQLSLSIGLFNLVPIPILDGGHLALLILEGIRGRKLTAEQTHRVLATGFAILIFLFVWVMFNDITRLFRAG